MNYCMKIQNATRYALTDCRAFVPYVKSKVRYVDRLKDIIADYLSSPSERMKRGILDLGGDVLKFLFGTSIMSFNITMQKVNRNEKILNDNLLRLNKMVVEEMNNMQTQIDSVMVLNENIQQIQRGLEECQHTLEILVDAFLHAQDGIIQPQLITITKLRDMMKKESLPDGLDFPSFPILELSRLITPIIFSQNSYLVHVLQVPLLQSTSHHLYKLQPFPMKQQDKVFVYIETMKDFIFTDAMRQKYGKMSYPELQACLMPNELTCL